MYILVDPTNNKPFQFSNFKNDSFYIVKGEEYDTNGNRVITPITALCIEHEYDSTLLSKTYNPSTGTFS